MSVSSSSSGAEPSGTTERARSLAGRAGSLIERLPLCLAGACLWALPHLGFGSRPGVGPLGFLALVGTGLASLALVMTALRPPRAEEGDGLAGSAVALGLGLALAPWSGLAYWLAVATHHRPLGAVTFAVGAVAIGAVAIGVARRLVATRSAQGPLFAAAAACAGIGALGLVLVAARGVTSDSALRSAVPDLVLGVVLALLVTFLPVAPRMAKLARAALVGCLCLWSVTLGLLRLEPDVRATVKSVPVIAGVVGLAVR